NLSGLLKFTSHNSSPPYIAYKIQALPTKTSTLQSISKFLGLVLFALLGGLILNLMPCVLPVLSLKILSLLQDQNQQSASQTRKSAWIYTLGVLFSFLILSLTLILL